MIGETNLEIKLDSTTAANHVWQKFRALIHGQFDHLRVGQLSDDVDDVMEVRQDQLLQRLQFLGLRRRFTAAAVSFLQSHAEVSRTYNLPFARVLYGT